MRSHIAVVGRCPFFGGDIEFFNADEAKKIPGVRQVLVLLGPKPDPAAVTGRDEGVAVKAGFGHARHRS